MTSHTGPNFVITAIELLFLMVIAFIVPGVIAPIASPAATHATEARQRADTAQEAARERQERLALLEREHDALAKEAEATASDRSAEALRNEIERRRAAVAVLRDRETRAAQSAAVATAEIDRFQRQISAVEGREKELRELEAALGGRAADVTALKASADKHRTRLAELQAALADAGKPKYGFESGTPLARADRQATRSYGVVLSAGRVSPLAAPYYTGRRNQDGSTTVWPAKPGLAIEEALRQDSPIVREITSPSFRQGGRVTMLVAADSFATYRALRDMLVREQIDFGWEPIESTTIRFSDNAGSRQIPSTAPR